jgi:3-phosphoshikimate 1-carboxyvinyltransferase
VNKRSVITVRGPAGPLLGAIDLAGSKSIANRALIIRALSGEDFPIQRLANAKDTQLLDALLRSDAGVLDAGAAGTTFRFLTAYLALQPGEQILTGTERMKQRPIGALVNALRALGARIDYLEQEGYPPLRIGAPGDLRAANPAISVPASTSSQFISALLMIAPVLPKGLRLTLAGKIVSRSYIDMTLNLMRYFGANCRWRGNTIEVDPQAYIARPFTVEADWSAASYFYALAAISASCDLRLNGLYENSVQGDAVLADMMRAFGVETTFEGEGVSLRRLYSAPPTRFEYDFLLCPDLAQTLAAVCAAAGVPGYFSGLETLRIKETDRLAALQRELSKVGVSVIPLEENGDVRMRVEGKAKVENSPLFHTYEDHRMAMALATLAILGPIDVADPEVVEKSYPDFWSDLRRLGFSIEKK